MKIPSTYPATSSECHPERSEGSLSFRHSPQTAEICRTRQRRLASRGFRFAQNDTIQKRGFRTGSTLITGLALLIGAAGQMWAANPSSVSEFYTEPPLYHSTPDPKKEKHFGDVGVTGLKVRIYPGVVIKVEETVPGTPADGKFAKGDVITGVNGVALKGRNPYVVLGEALTAAEAKDGKLVFEVEGKKPVTVVIPALGAYSATWPLHCQKSQAIIRGAAAYYARTLEYAGGSHTDRDKERHGIGGALACLFLLSTGDDQYLPRVKSYFDELGRNIKGIGDNTWANGYNGIACAEYYLRTGDKSVLPVLQYYCDDARDRQFYGVGWGHWGREINPGYVSGGLMNPAGAQVATTLLLAKECGVNVDDRTMLGALQYFYRFAGRGSVAYGDHRGEGGLGSNGKDGMAAALMQVATGARGDTEVYRRARNYFALSMLDSFPALVTGHGDEGRGDAIWRSITSAYLHDLKPEAYRTTMDTLKWWYDLSRRPSGALGVATAQRFDDEGSGAGVAIAYTAPLRTLRITGAPRSKFAKDFTLPVNPWGRPADLAFLSIAPDAQEPVYQLARKLGDAYSAEPNYAGMSAAELAQIARHRNYMIRAQAAKALMHTGAFGELEKMMADPDPRVRRAACDGLTDYRYWFAVGKKPIRPEDVSPKMVAALRKMLTDPNEAIYTVDGALMALSCATPAAVAGCVPDILPWTTHEEWWVRQSAFRALATAAQAEGMAAQVLPVLAEMLRREQRPTARETMNGLLARLAPTLKMDREIVMAFQRAAAETEIKPGPRAGEGGYYVQEAALAGLRANPASAPEMARSVRARFPQLQTRYLVKVVEALVAAREQLPEAARGELTDVLDADYRRELIRRMNAGETPLDTILTLTQLKHPEVGWREVGRPVGAERVWRFTSFEPQGADVMHPREGKRFRDVALPVGLANWYLPEFDAGQWTSGKAPIGKGVFTARRGKKAAIENQSTWGDGEFLLARTTFELDAVDCDYYRLGVLAKQGYHIYLNGQKIYTYIWWSDAPEYRKIGLGADAVKHLKKGANVLAVYANAAYVDGEQVGQLDVRLEGLKKEDLLQ